MSGNESHEVTELLLSKVCPLFFRRQSSCCAVVWINPYELVFQRVSKRRLIFKDLLGLLVLKWQESLTEITLMHFSVKWVLHHQSFCYFFCIFLLVKSECKMIHRFECCKRIPFSSIFTVMAFLFMCFCSVWTVWAVCPEALVHCQLLKCWTSPITTWTRTPCLGTSSTSVSAH